VTVPANSSGYVMMNLFVYLHGTDASGSNDGYNGGTLMFMSEKVGSAKLNGDFGPQKPVNPIGDTNPEVDPVLGSPPFITTVSTGGVGTGAVNVGFSGVGYTLGAPNDLNGDGDQDWGNPLIDKQYSYNPSHGNEPMTKGQWVNGTTAGMVGGMTKIKIGSVVFNYGGYHYSQTITAADPNSEDPENPVYNTEVYNFDGPGSPAGVLPGQSTKVAALALDSSFNSHFFKIDTAAMNPTTSWSDQVGPYYQAGMGIPAGYGVTISTEGVPEPATFALLGIGGLVLIPLAWRRRRG
jgi:hypothetical protein